MFDLLPPFSYDVTVVLNNCNTFLYHE